MEELLDVLAIGECGWGMGGIRSEYGRLLSQGLVTLVVGIDSFTLQYSGVGAIMWRTKDVIKSFAADQKREHVSPWVPISRDVRREAVSGVRSTSCVG